MKSQSKNQTKPIYSLKNSKFFLRHQNLLLLTYYFENNVCFISKGYIDFFLFWRRKEGIEDAEYLTFVMGWL